VFFIDFFIDDFFIDFFIDLVGWSPPRGQPSGTAAFIFLLKFGTNTPLLEQTAVLNYPFVLNHLRDHRWRSFQVWMRPDNLVL
jgi:hypothetical protein